MCIRDSNWSGELGPGVSAKDMALKMCAALGMDAGQYQAIQYYGDTITALDIFERMTLCNMAAELGAQAGLIEPDAKTAAYIRDAGSDPGNWDLFKGDADARVAVTHNFDARALAPQVAAPHSPANADDAASVEKVEIDQFYICLLYTSPSPRD